MKNLEGFRRDLTLLLTDAKSRLELPHRALAQVTEYIENHEFGLAYELMMYELRGKQIPADAAESLKAAANIMGLENSNEDTTNFKLGHRASNTDSPEIHKRTYCEPRTNSVHCFYRRPAAPIVCPAPESSP